MYEDSQQQSSKLAEIQTLTELNMCDILCVSETWLDNKIADSGLLSDYFNIFRRDRKGGGLLMAVNANIQATVLKLMIWWSRSINRWS